MLNSSLNFKFVFASKNLFIKLTQTAKMSSVTPSVDISSLRAKYRDFNDVFDLEHLQSRDPFAQFKYWFDVVLTNKLSKEPNAMCLATCGKDGRPTNRIVLLKDFSSDQGFKFFTNYTSKKGQNLEENPYASLCFYWEALSRQVRIEGKVHKISEEESNDYFTKRPFNSRVSAYISDQSKVIKDRQVLLDDKQKATDEFGPTQTVPKPSNWGGYLLVPDEFEFWQGNDIRLHDRLRFRKPKDGEVVDFGNGIENGENGWVIERLSP